MDYQRRVWATVDADLLAKIEEIQGIGEEASGVKPTIGKVVLMLIKAGIANPSTRWRTVDLLIDDTQ